MGKQMKVVEAELKRVRDEIARLRIEEGALARVLAQGSSSAPPQSEVTRTRSPSVKPVVLDIMRQAGAAGATTAEVDDLVRQKVPSVAKDTVGSILSRLKSEGALAYTGERYYEKQFAPSEDNAFASIRVVK